MEHIGKRIKENSKGLGIVNSYDPSINQFEILYENGRSEVLGLSDISSLLFEQEEEDSISNPRVRKKPKIGGEKADLSSKSGDDVSRLNNLNNSIDVSRVNPSGTSASIVDVKLNLNDVVALDLNNGFDLNVVDDGFGLDVINCEREEKKMNRKSLCNIDLNIDANGEFEESTPTPKRERCFDLNMGLLDDEIKNDEVENDCPPQVAKGEGSDSKKGEEISFDANVGTHLETDITCSYIEGDSCSDKIGKNIDINSIIGSKGDSLEDQSKDCTPPIHENQENCGNLGMGKRAKRKKRVAENADSSVETTLRRSRRRLAIGSGLLNVRENISGEIVEEATLEDVEGKDLVDFEGKFCENRTPINNNYQGKSGSTVGRRKGRKKTEILDNGNITTETLSRRTSVRIASSISGDNEAQSSGAIVVRLEETFATAYEKMENVENLNVFPPKMKLPLSSQKLDLGGIPILDLFSVYTCLRSFSTLLFLSPFDLEDLVAAIKCEYGNMLFDSIHVSLLQTLRKHMESLSDENISSATICLRSLNWDFLDTITWPIFMVNYLLIHGSALKADFDLPKLRLFESEYYKQPPVVKIEMLRCLCDDVIDVETIRSEINRRTLATDPNMDIDRNIKNEISKKRRSSMDAMGGSCLTEEVADETVDWNSDDCCLCKMDGNLICCDGCPAAYHMKCVGVSNNSLPDGDWYCPECLINKENPWLKMGNSLRGAEILGVDPYGRVYYLSAGYLLVLDSCDSESSCHYYHRNDLTAVIEALKSSGHLYKPIHDAISKNFRIYVNSYGKKSNLDWHNISICLEPSEEQVSTSSVLKPHLTPSESCGRYEALDEKGPEENSVVVQYSGITECENIVKPSKMETLLTSSEGSVETSQVPECQNLNMAGSDVTKKSVTNLGTNLNISDISLTSTNLSGIDYVNCYRFAYTSSMVVEELTRRSKDKPTESSIKSVDDFISFQLKAISKKSTKFVWPIFRNRGSEENKEKCGWCFPCRAAETDEGSRNCLFDLNIYNPQGVDKELAGLCLQKNMEGHLIDVIFYIIYMEDRLRGLLLGPWINPQYTNLWRQSVVKASDVASLKYFLLMLEANLNDRVLSPDWKKPVDSFTTMGSASHIITSSSRISSKNGITRKLARNSDLEPKPSLNSASGLGILWRRGGRLSRKLYNWKGLPRSLASKAARQAGCTKVPGLLYPDSSDFTKRNRSVIWKADVEASRSLEQLALQVRELDANIKWDDIENTHVSKTDQYKKSVRSFKKAIIRRKITEGTVVKYLLDFGKRRYIPDIVLNNGSIVEESSSGRKKYWLEETHVPLYLLKTFEERRIARKCNSTNPGKNYRSDIAKKRTSKRKGFCYLFAKAQESKYYQCGYCNKDVLIREAVLCLHCKGFFHKRHVKKSPGAAARKFTYSCHKCQGRKSVKPETKKGKKLVIKKSKNSPVESRVLWSKIEKKISGDVRPTRKLKINKKNSAVLPLRRSPRKLRTVALQSKKVVKRKKGKAKGKKTKSTENVTKQPKVNTWQKKRTHAYHAYWLNGARFSQKPDDERVLQFMEKSLVAPLSLPSVSMFTPPKCSLSCEQDFTPSLSYVGCEICEDWFHGDAFGLDLEKLDSIIGFRCHKCRSKTAPVCPHLKKKTKNEATSGEANTCDDKELKD